MKYGCIKSPRDLRNYRVIAKSIELPKKYDVGHSLIKNQGNVCSCVAHSVSEILEKKDNINYSTEWIYGYREEKYYQGKGMCLLDALKTIKNIGYIEYKDLQGNYEMDKAKDIVDKDINKYKDIANKKKIGSYAELHTMMDIKEAIYTGKNPVLMALAIDKGGLILDKNIARIPKIEDSCHAVVCYGWNEKGLLIQNSWGEEWGDKGTFILPYEYPFYEAWAISYEIKNNDKKQTLNIEKPKYYWLRELIMYIIRFIRSIKKGR